jgi:hypothetical protein
LVNDYLIKIDLNGKQRSIIVILAFGVLKIAARTMRHQRKGSTTVINNGVLRRLGINIIIASASSIMN